MNIVKVEKLDTDEYSYRIRWQATYQCNYKCPYCYEWNARNAALENGDYVPGQKDFEFAAKQIVRLVEYNKIPEVSIVIVGGEMSLFNCLPIFKPIDDCSLVKKFYLTTNLYNTPEYYNNLLEGLSPKFKLVASYQHGQCNIEEFISKVNKIPKLRFVNCVITNDNFDVYKKLIDECNCVVKPMNCRDTKTNLYLLAKDPCYRNICELAESMSPKNKEKNYRITFEDGSEELINKNHIRLRYPEYDFTGYKCKTVGLNIRPSGSITWGSCANYLKNEIGNIYKDYKIDVNTQSSLVCSKGDNCLVFPCKELQLV